MSVKPALSADFSPLAHHSRNHIEIAATSAAMTEIDAEAEIRQ